MKTTPKRILALLLALGLLLSLCACGQKEQAVPDEPKMSTDKVDLLTKADKKTPERQPEEAISQSDMSDRVSRDEATETQPVQYGFSQEAETSLGWLRDRIDVTGVMFGAAYLGYVGGLFDEGFEAGFPAWLWETNEAMLREYPFIAEIDENRPELRADVQEQVNIEIKYEGYIQRQKRQVEQFKKLESRKIPEDLDYEQIGSLRIEARQKLEAYRPISIGQASRISGVSPADISVLLVYLSSK